MTAVGSLEAAQACFAGAATAYDCVLLEYGLLAGGPAAATTAFFKQAAAAHAPVVLMAGAITIGYRSPGACSMACLQAMPTSQPACQPSCTAPRL